MGRAPRQLKLTGVFAAALTPNLPGSLDVDYCGLLDLLDFLADGGVGGICLAGSTGEFLNYTFSDRQRMVYLSAKRSRVPLVVGVGHSTLAGALQLAGDAIAAGADALLVLPPYFYPLAQPEVEQFCLELAQETGDAVPLLLYNIPQFTTGMAFETVRRLLDTGRFAGIKDSSGDWNYFEQLLSLKRERSFALLAGHDRIALRALRAGADGILSGCACAVPELLVALWRDHNSSQAETWDARLQEFVDWIEKFPVPVGIKRAVGLRRQKAGSLATPLAPATRELVVAFEEWFNRWHPII